MINALTTAATGLEAQQANMERISADLANVNTDGYKRSRTEFQDLMYETIKEAGGSLGAGTQSPVGIQVGHGVKVGASHKVFEQGPSRTTGNQYDLLIEGRGFFPLQMPSGEVLYTRNGAFHLDAQGRLMTAAGGTLIPQITIPSNASSVTVSPTGEVVAALPNNGQATLGQIQLTSFVNEQGLSAVGGNLFRMTLGSGAPIQSVPGENGVGMIAQNALEGANVNVANSMVDMIATQRAYEMGTKVMGVADQMWSATINVK